ncbi:MAG TPA: FAD-dependent monooxygenase, partial [Acidimicrobiales bacterium]|nr:FAD-dependent monooxygenase [Acidimicrobiales bacterium]
MSSDPADVLVVGAGPTGLALALQAHDHGARVRIVERRAELSRPSRALIMHPRTLEVLRPHGVTDALLARGDLSPSAHLHLGTRVVPVRLADLDLPDTEFPHLLLIRQADVERVLWEALVARGLEVERGVELSDVAALGDHAVATLRRAGAETRVPCRYVAGCDGPASIVRDRAGIGWRGRSYRQEVVLADVELDGLTPDVAHAVPGPRGLVFVFPIGERATWRVLATRPAGADELPFGQPGPAVPAGEVQGLLDTAGLDARISRVGWSAKVRLQHRLALRFRHGPLFVVGDAAHAHSPAGGQGMNLGMQDALNLGWKLAGAARSPGTLAGPLLDSYEIERRPAARQVLALTHAVFWAEASTDPVATAARRLVARWAAPIVPPLLRRRRLVGAGVRTLSQLRIHYRRSPLSVEGTPAGPPGPRPGERVPDAQVVTAAGRSVRLHDLIARPGIHALVQRDAPGLDLPSPGGDVHVHRIASWPGAGVVVVRPDGYVGFRSGEL